MGFFDFLLGKKERGKKKEIISKKRADRISKLENELEFKNREIISLHMQNTNLLRQTEDLIKTIQSINSNLITRLERQSLVYKGNEEIEEPEIEINDALNHYEKGQSLLRQRKYKAAIEQFNKALNLEKSYKDALVGKGICFSKTNKKEKALECFDQAIEIDKESKEAWLNKGVCLDDLGQHKEAIKCFDKVIFINNKK